MEKDEDGRWVFTVNNKTYTDYVSGISLADIETAARTSRNIEEWQEAIIEMYPEKTAQILNAFNFWKY